jgi:hypothetical protein
MPVLGSDQMLNGPPGVNHQGFKKTSRKNRKSSFPLVSTSNIGDRFNYAGVDGGPSNAKRYPQVQPGSNGHNNAGLQQPVPQPVNGFSNGGNGSFQQQHSNVPLQGAANVIPHVQLSQGHPQGVPQGPPPQVHPQALSQPPLSQPPRIHTFGSTSNNGSNSSFGEQQQSAVGSSSSSTTQLQSQSPSQSNSATDLNGLISGSASNQSLVEEAKPLGIVSDTSLEKKKTEDKKKFGLFKKKK